MTNVIDLFPRKEKDGHELSLEDHITEFLNQLDNSLSTFHTMGVMDKYNLYKALVDFTHVSLHVYLKSRQGI